MSWLTIVNDARERFRCAPLAKHFKTLRAISIVALAACVIVMFLRSALAHIANPYYFLSAINSYRLVPPYAGLAVAMGVPYLQLAVVACLVTRQFVPAAFAVSAILFLAFWLAQVSAMLRGLEIDCGCFGAQSVAVGAGTVSAVGVLAIGSAIASVSTARISWTNAALPPAGRRR